MFEERYILQERVGNGKMSSVHLALDTVAENTQVAVKILNTHHPDEIKRELFRRETSALKRLSHPNIVKLLNSGWSESERAFFLIFDYVPYSLDMYLRGELGTTLNKFNAYQIVRQLASALSYAHSEGVIHRDIKPSNILLDATATPLLTDFGISKLLTQLTVGETLAAFWSGGYASPEQRAGATTTPESDIYSLGAVFFHLLSGQIPPPEGPTPSMVDQHVNGPPLRTVLRRMLEENPETRLPKGELQAALDATRRLEVLPRHFLVMTRNAVRDVIAAGYSQTEDILRVSEAVLEDLGGNELEEVNLHSDNRGDIILLGDSLRFICVPDNDGDALVVKAIQTPYLPNLDIERGRSMSHRAMWVPVEQGFRSAETSSSLSLAADELTSLLAKITTYEKIGAVSQERRNSRHEFIERWELALSRNRNRIEAEAITLGYSEVIEEPDYLQFILEKAPPDDLGLEDDTALSVRESPHAPRFSVGNLLGIHGRMVEVARHKRRFRREDAPIPQQGQLTIDVTEALASNSRQHTAVTAFLYEQMANPGLARVIVDPSQTTHASESDLDFFQDFLSDDKKEAVRKAIASNELFLIQGPPGTGKTSVIAEIALQILRKEPDARILLTSQSNVAVDHALSQIARAAGDAPPEMIRLGRVDKIGRIGRSWTLTERALSWRQDILRKCEPKISELTLEERSARAAAREAGIPSEGSGMQALEEMIAEAKEITEQLHESEEEHSSLGPVASVATKSAAAEAAEQKRLELREHLDALSDLLPQPIDAQNMTEEETLAEIIKAHATVHQNVSDATHPTTQRLRQVQELRKTLTDWTKVVGLTQDFQELIGKSSRVIAATCLYSGRRSSLPGGEVSFDWAIVDEAGRATVPEVLIPIVRSERAILVGDERQLPPMVEDLMDKGLDDLPEGHSLDTSLFQSLVEQAGGLGADCVTSLRTQYRMHPAIGSLISTVFYDGGLENGQQARTRRSAFDWMPAPVTWISTSSSIRRAETRDGDSFANPFEAEVILQLLYQMEDRCRRHNRRPTIGVISGYSAQVAHLATQIDADNKARWANLQIEIATVDSFQGRECDAVVYSTVRSNRERTIGFLRDRRRINVALSRARDLVVVVGDNHMMETATIGPTLNPFASVLDYIRMHASDCRIIPSNLVKML